MASATRPPGARAGGRRRVGQSAGQSAGHDDGVGTEARRRADAQRSIEAILRAGLAEVARTGEVNISDIARLAGVGRVTLYGHFATKEALVEAMVEHAIMVATAALQGLDVEHGPTPQRLHELTVSSWEVLNEHRQLMEVGHRYLGPERMRRRHGAALAGVERLLARGQQTGELRGDVPQQWLVATFYALLHAAAAEVNAGRLEASAAGPVVASTITAALRA
jgi:AcrR family transcriptional regulator